jgi:hypothetical protein
MFLWKPSNNKYKLIPNSITESDILTNYRYVLDFQIQIKWNQFVDGKVYLGCRQNGIQNIFRNKQT